MSKVDVETAYREYLENLGAIPCEEDWAGETLFQCRTCDDYFTDAGDLNADDDCDECAKKKDNISNI